MIRSCRSGRRGRHGRRGRLPGSRRPQLRRARSRPVATSVRHAFHWWTSPRDATRGGTIRGSGTDESPPVQLYPGRRVRRARQFRYLVQRGGIRIQHFKRFPCLFRELTQGRDNVRIECGQERQHVPANSIARETRIGVGGILAIGLAERGEIRQHVGARHGEQRPDDVAALRRDAAQTLKPHAADQSMEDGLRLVVGRVAGRDPAGAYFGRDFREEFVTNPPRRRFEVRRRSPTRQHPHTSPGRINPVARREPGRTPRRRPIPRRGAGG